MKKQLTLTIAAIMTMQTLAFANTTKDQRQQLIEDANKISVENMSLDQLESALTELKGHLATIALDLRTAEQQDGDRLAIKVRNGIAISTVAFAVYNMIRANNTNLSGDARMGNAVAFFLLGGLGIAGTAVTQGYIYLTRSELRDMKKTISALNEKIELIQFKIDQRKANLK